MTASSGMQAILQDIEIVNNMLTERTTIVVILTN